MSSNHTYLSTQEWEEMQAYASRTDAYILQSSLETARLERLAAERRRQAELMAERTRRQIAAARDALVVSFRDAISRSEGAFSSSTETACSDFSSRLNALQRDYARMDARISTMNAEIESIGQQFGAAFNAYLRDISDAKEGASLYLNELNHLIGQIDSLNPALLAPREYEQLQLTLQTAERNLQAGMAQASLISSQTGIVAAGTLLTRLTVLQEQYLLQTESVRRALERLGERFDFLSSPEGALNFPLCGAMHTFPYDINFWSDGQFSHLTEQYHDLENSLEHLSPEQIDRMQQQIDALDHALTVCDAEARREFAGSVSVQHLAEELGARFDDTGWQPIEERWTDDDERKPYTMLYKDGAGNDVSIVISTGADPENPMLSFEVYSDDEADAAATKRGLISLLPELGMEHDYVEQRNDCHLNPTPRDFMQNTVRESEARRAQRRRTYQKDR